MLHLQINLLEKRTNAPFLSIPIKYSAIAIFLVSLGIL